MKQGRLALVVTAALVVAAGSASADETTFCNAYIRTLPYTIATQGHYCFDRNLSTSIASGNAITINSDFVVLDLNNFKLGGGGAGLGTTAAGVYALDHRNITIRNGNIRGFYFGIRLEGTTATSGGHVIENNVLDANTYTAAAVSGDTLVVRNNVVSNTGGSTVSGTSGWGLFLDFNSFASARDNVVTNTFGTSYAFGICCPEGQHDKNLVKLGSAAVRYGIYGSASTLSTCRDNTVFDADFAFGDCILAGHNFSSP